MSATVPPYETRKPEPTTTGGPVPSPIEQLCLSPQCGFSSTVEGNALTREDQMAKLELIVETAEEVWG
jgi:hypothetical protein